MYAIRSYYEEQGDLVIDPVLPTELDGLHFDFQYAGMKITFIYHITGGPVRNNFV